MKAAVLTVSTSLAGGEGEDVSGPALVALCEAAGLEVTHTVVSDDREAIAAVLRRLADAEGARFVFTTGGTGLTPDDVTPEATRDVIEREAPGYAESIRTDSRRHTPLGILSRGVFGCARAHLDRELPRQSEGHRAVMARRGAHAAPRRRDARALVRRRSARCPESVSHSDQ